jgi:hypothetical protein
MDSHPISLLEGAEALRRAIYQRALEPAARRSNSPLKRWNFSGNVAGFLKIAVKEP